MKYILFAFTIFIFIFSCTDKRIEKQLTEVELRDKANQLAQDLLIIDTHIDVPYRLNEKMEDISIRTQGGHFDYPRARSGGLDVPFMSIYIPAELQKEGGAKALADNLIDMVEGFQEKWPGKFGVAKSIADVLKQQKNGDIISLPMGMENGSGIEGDLKNLQHFYNRGIRYITLTHSKYNEICDSSYDPDKHWNGLSPFGIKVVEEMNRLGIMVDISHVSDSAFYQVLNISKVPVIASHSSCRFFTPGWERNMNDEMISALAENGGIIQITFGSEFINDAFRKKAPKSTDLSSQNLNESDQTFDVQVQEVVDHIDHVNKLVGINHIGLGSDFDGVDNLPEGLSDVSMFPNLIYHLLKRGYSEEDIAKICSGNTLRVWQAVEDFATKN